MVRKARTGSRILPSGTGAPGTQKRGEQQKGKPSDRRRLHRRKHGPQGTITGASPNRRLGRRVNRIPRWQLHHGWGAIRSIRQAGTRPGILATFLASATGTQDHNRNDRSSQKPASHHGTEEISRHGLGRYTASAFGSNRRRFSTRCWSVGWVRRNHAVLPPWARVYSPNRCQNSTAAEGGYPALAM